MSLKSYRYNQYHSRTETFDSRWIKRLVLLHNKPHPSKMSSGGVIAYLSYLANEQDINCSAFPINSDGSQFLKQPATRLTLSLLQPDDCNKRL